MPANLHDNQILEEKARERRSWRTNILGVYKGDYVDISLILDQYKRYKRIIFLNIECTLCWGTWFRLMD